MNSAMHMHEYPLGSPRMPEAIGEPSRESMSISSAFPNSS